MTRKEAFEKIKKLFADEAQPTQAKLMDGTLVQWDGDLAEGVAIMVLDTDGNTTPAPDGSIQLEDGATIDLVGGLVTKITPDDEGAEADAEMMSKITELFASKMEDFNKTILALTEKVNAYDAKFAEISDKFASKESVDNKFSAIQSIVESIADEPTVIVPSPKNIAFKKKGGDKTAAEKIIEFRNSLKK